jgi:N-acyl-D-aspartate/D-glutamate deacylase
MDDRDIDAFMLHPLASISTDGDLVKPGQGFPHPRSYGAFPRVLGRYVRERHLMKLESAVMKMTHRVALDLQLEKRGLLKPGYFADLVIFDADRIVDRATYADPHRYSEGVIDLLVNGVPVIRSGALTGTLPGIPIRRAGWKR